MRVEDRRKGPVAAEQHVRDIICGSVFEGVVGASAQRRVLFRGFGVVVDLITGGVWRDDTQPIVQHYRPLNATVVIEPAA